MCQVRRGFQACRRVGSQLALMTTGEMLLAVGCRDDRPIIASGSVVSTCPVEFSTSVPTDKVNCGMNLESVLGESCITVESSAMFFSPTEKGNTMSVNFLKSLTKMRSSVCAPGLWQRLSCSLQMDEANPSCIDHVHQVMETHPGAPTCWT